MNVSLDIDYDTDVGYVCFKNGDIDAWSPRMSAASAKALFEATVRGLRAHLDKARLT